jgi:hypothetical protein
MCSTSRSWCPDHTSAATSFRQVAGRRGSWSSSSAGSGGSGWSSESSRANVCRAQLPAAARASCDARSFTAGTVDAASSAKPTSPSNTSTTAATSASCCASAGGRSSGGGGVAPSGRGGVANVGNAASRSAASTGSMVATGTTAPSIAAKTSATARPAWTMWKSDSGNTTVAGLWGTVTSSPGNSTARSMNRDWLDMVDAPGGAGPRKARRRRLAGGGRARGSAASGVHRFDVRAV